MTWSRDWTKNLPKALVADLCRACSMLSCWDKAAGCLLRQTVQARQRQLYAANPEPRLARMRTLYRANPLPARARGARRRDEKAIKAAMTRLHDYMARRRGRGAD